MTQCPASFASRSPLSQAEKLYWLVPGDTGLNLLKARAAEIPAAHRLIELFGPSPIALTMIRNAPETQP